VICRREREGETSGGGSWRRRFECESRDLGVCESQGEAYELAILFMVDNLVFGSAETWV
jgi:hypothetical protein